MAAKIVTVYEPKLMDTGLVDYPTLVQSVPLQPICADDFQPKPLTDTEKAIYLKLVELAKAGKIEWKGSCCGTFGNYEVNVGSNIELYYVRTDDGDYAKEFITIACFCVSGTQIVDDLRLIAKEQYETARKRLTDKLTAELLTS